MIITEDDIKPSTLNNLCDKLMRLSVSELDLLEHAVYTVLCEKILEAEGCENEVNTED